MKLNVAICDDSLEILSYLRETLENYSVARDIDLSGSEFSTGEDLLDMYNRGSHFDVLLLDIELPGKNGIQVADVVRRQYDKHVIIVFMSLYPQYMHDSFSVHPYHYIQKPFETAQIFGVFDEIAEMLQESRIMITLIDTTEAEMVVRLHEIFYIECLDSKKRVLEFHTEAGSVVTHGMISEWQDKLQEYGFYLCHQSFLVNIEKVHFLETKTLMLIDGERIPVSRSKHKTLKELFLNSVIAFNNAGRIK